MSVEYQIVRESGSYTKICIDCVESTVKSLCSKGWEPVGGIAICKISEHYEDYIVTQAMIRKPR